MGASGESRCVVSAHGCGPFVSAALDGLREPRTHEDEGVEPQESVECESDSDARPWASV